MGVNDVPIGKPLSMTVLTVVGYKKSSAHFIIFVT